VTQDTTERERVRSVLIEQAEKPLSELFAACEESRRHLLAALEGVSEAQARFRPGDREARPEDEEAWSMAEVLRHLIQAEEGIAERVWRVAKGEAATSSVPGALGDHETTPLPGLLEALRSSRERLRAAVTEVDGSERLDATVAHPFFGELNCRGWLALWGRHEMGHVRQVGQIKATPGYPES
jgi:uncharacterized damage-inducible protein DinB